MIPSSVNQILHEYQAFDEERSYRTYVENKEFLNLLSEKYSMSEFERERAESCLNGASLLFEICTRVYSLSSRELRNSSYFLRAYPYFHALAALFSRVVEPPVLDGDVVEVVYHSTDHVRLSPFLRPYVSSAKGRHLAVARIPVVVILRCLLYAFSPMSNAQKFYYGTKNQTPQGE